MSLNGSLAIAPLLLSAALSAWLSYNAWQRRSAPGATGLVLITAAVTLWLLAYALELSVRGLGPKLFWARLQYPSIVALPVAWFVFAWQYVGMRPQPLRRLAVLALVPALTLALVFSNQAHGLVWSVTELDTSGLLPTLRVSYGPWFWVHAGYSYLLLLLGSWLIVREYLRLRPGYRRQGAVILLAALAPWVGNVLHLAGLDPIPAVDSTPLSFALTGLMLSLGLFSFRLFELIPVARAAVLEAMRDGVMVVDVYGRLTDINPAAAAILAVEPGAVLGHPVDTLLGPQVLAALGQPAAADWEGPIALGEGALRRDLEVRISALRDQRSRLIGRLLVLRDVTATRQAEVARQKLAALIEYSSDFIGMADYDGRISFINRAGCALVGLGGLAAARARRMDEVIAADDRGRFQREILPLVMRDGSWSGELQFAHFAGGAPIPMQFSVFLVRDAESGAPLAFASVSRDNREAHRLARLRDDLTHTMVHDLRNPLTAIQGALEILRSLRVAEPDSQELVEIAARASRRMLGLVNGILDLSRLESGQMPLRPAALPLPALVAESVRLLTPLSEVRQQEVRVHVEAQLPSGWADPDLLGRVLQNLIGNAIKFTPAQGLIAVELGVWDQSPHFLRVAVADSGPGIPDDVRGRLFEKFVTGSNREGGSGLGLAFCRLAIEAHGGKIWLDEQASQGARFCFTLPVAAPQPLALEASGQPESAPRPHAA